MIYTIGTIVMFAGLIAPVDWEFIPCPLEYQKYEIQFDAKCIIKVR